MLIRGIDITDAEEPDSKLTIRKIWIAFCVLPEKNAVTEAIASLDIDEILWDTNTYVLANIFDAIQNLTYLTESVHTPRGKPRPKTPTRHPRPGKIDRRSALKKLPMPTAYSP